MYQKRWRKAQYESPTCLAMIQRCPLCSKYTQLKCCTCWILWTVCFWIWKPGLTAQVIGSKCLKQLNSRYSGEFYKPVVKFQLRQFWLDTGFAPIRYQLMMRIPPTPTVENYEQNKEPFQGAWGNVSKHNVMDLLTIITLVPHLIWSICCSDAALERHV